MLRTRRSSVMTSLAMLLAASGAIARAQTPLDTTFTYQGRLDQGGVPVNGTADFEFRLFDAITGGNQISDTMPLFGVPVSGGVFTVQLPAPPEALDGQARWIEVRVRTPHDPSGTLPLTLLTSRQPVTATPYASHALEAQIALNAMQADKVNGLHVDSDGTLVLGATGERDGELHVEDNRPLIVLDTQSNSYDSRASIWFNHYGDLKGWISFNTDDERLGFRAGSTYFNLMGDGRASFGNIIDADASLHVQFGSDLSLVSEDHFLQLGRSTSLNLAFDDNEIMARDGGLTSPLYLNHQGGNVFFGAGSGGTTQVGINTASPGAFDLAVNGSAAKPGGGSWSSFSDARLKKNIRPLGADALERLLSLRGYQFEYRDEAIERRLALPGTRIGLVAQEVEQVFPDWIDEDEEGYKFVTERGTTALFVEALRTLRAERDAQIAELREIIETQQLQIEALCEAVSTDCQRVAIIGLGDHPARAPQQPPLQRR